MHNSKRVLSEKAESLGGKSDIIKSNGRERPPPKKKKKKSELKFNLLIACSFRATACAFCVCVSVDKLAFVEVSCHKLSQILLSPTGSPTVSPTKLPPREKTNTHPSGVTQHARTHTLTSPALDAPLGPGHGEDGEAVVVLGAAGLDGTDVAVAAGPEHAWKIQRLHGLGLHLPEHGLAHGLKLAVQCVSQLEDGEKKERVRRLTSCRIHTSKWGLFATCELVRERV